MLNLDEPTGDPVETMTLTYHTFINVFTPLEDSSGRDLFEWEDIKDFPANHVWTVVQGDDGGLYAIPGFHVANRVNYMVTLKPWEHDDYEAVIVEGDDYEEEEN